MRVLSPRPVGEGSGVRVFSPHPPLLDAFAVIPHPDALPKGEGIHLPSPRRRGAGGEGALPSPVGDQG
jgi:hypothetical protein